MLFAIVAWIIWKRRNAFFFENEQVAQTNPSARIYSLASEAWWMASNVRATHLGGPWQADRWVRWIPLLNGWYKLNTDSGCNATTDKSYAGGVIRDDKGDWFAGFSQALNPIPPWQAEIHGIARGLEVALSLGVTKDTA